LQPRCVGDFAVCCERPTVAGTPTGQWP
jgi:hypothetical protein